MTAPPAVSELQRSPIMLLALQLVPRTISVASENSNSHDEGKRRLRKRADPTTLVSRAEAREEQYSSR